LRKQISCHLRENFKTGQTLMKTIIAPGLKSRMLGLHGWYSTNILGTATGEVLDDPIHSRPRKSPNCQFSKYILQPEVYPKLYKDFPTWCASTIPTAWRQQRRLDNIDIFGWLGYPMQIKIDFLAVIRFWRRRLSLTSLCSWIWPIAPA